MLYLRKVQVRKHPWKSCSMNTLQALKYNNERTGTLKKQRHLGVFITITSIVQRGNV